jgi:hypothetical protein
MTESLSDQYFVLSTEFVRFSRSLLGGGFGKKFKKLTYFTSVSLLYFSFNYVGSKVYSHISNVMN